MKPSRKVQRAFSVHPSWAAALDNVRIVLVGTTHAGNIGAVARVMKNMGLRKLTLVSSTECGPETDAFAMASGAYDVVEAARSEIHLADALAETHMAVGTSARLGGKRVTARSPDVLIPQLMENAMAGTVACVFGRESRGMTNDELKLCTHHMIIPTDARFASMNVAHAVAVTAYEIFRVACRPIGFQTKPFTPAAVGIREEMYAHIEKVLIRAGFLDPSNPLRMMRDIRRILNSANMDARDVTIVRGIFRKVDNLVRIADARVRELEDRLTSGVPQESGE
ncbi:MAG: RNA methyltransferase [Desulfomonilaceae bacterium]|nr:RNA methyltransferase [Desulfomonilaceae bacterium]